MKPGTVGLQSKENTVNMTSPTLSVNPKAERVLEKHPCKLCIKVFRSSLGLLKHQDTYHKSKTQFAGKLEELKTVYECDFCDKVFTKEIYLNIHKTCHSGDKVGNFECPMCELKFLVRTKLDKHLLEQHYSFDSNKEKEKEAIACSFCRTGFNSKLEMILHKVECSKRLAQSDSFPCTCGKTFKAVRFLDNHMLTCSSEEDVPATPAVDNNNYAVPQPEESWSCDAVDCGKQYNKYVYFKNHLFTHTEYPFTCVEPGCKLSFTRKVSFFQHSARDHGTSPKLYQCKTCKEQFSVEDQLVTHVERVHDDEENDEIEGVLGESFSFEEDVAENSFICKMDKCKTVFKNLGELRRHYVFHNETLRICSKCNKKFSDREELNDHALVEHNIVLGRVVCPFCEEVFPLKKHLLTHLRSNHSKPWICAVCKFPISTIADANAHKEKHGPKACDVCREVFYCSSDLLQHMVGHDTEIESCPVQNCNIFFCVMENFEEHLIKHQKDKIFKCAKCEYQCYNLRQLECHLGSGHSQKPKPNEFTSDVNLECSVQGCTKSFVQEKWLIKHLKTMHSNLSSGPLKTEGLVRFRVKHKKFGYLTVPSKECVDAFHKSKGWAINLELLNLNAKDHAYCLSKHDGSKTKPTNQEADRNDDETTAVKQSSSNMTSQDSLEAPRIAELKKRIVLDIESDQADGSEKEFEFVNTSTPLAHLSSPASQPNPFVDNISFGNSDTSEDFFVEYVKDENQENLELPSDAVIVNAILTENPVHEVLISQCSLSYEDIVVSDTSLDQAVPTTPSCATAPTYTSPANSSLNIVKEEVVQPEYHQLISRPGCPEVGDFTALFGITAEMMLALHIPNELISVENSLAKGLVIDLLHLAATNNVENQELARYVYELLPEAARPSPTELTEEGARRLVDRIIKIRIQASRFRVRYNQFPKYLDKFLLEKINPFV